VLYSLAGPLLDGLLGETLGELFNEFDPKTDRWKLTFLCIRLYTIVHAILRGFLRCKKREDDLDVEKRKT
jgi:hypothetical protein